MRKEINVLLSTWKREEPFVAYAGHVSTTCFHSNHVGHQDSHMLLCSYSHDLTTSTQHILLTTVDNWQGGDEIVVAGVDQPQ